MIEFNKELWLERASKRSKGTVRRGSRNRSAAGAQLQVDKFYIECIADVVGWCSSRGLTVVFGKRPGGTYETGDKKIIIACRAAPEKQLYYLLHECGHHLIGFKEQDERFGMGYPKVDDPDYNSTFHHKFACLEEEMEAWHRGWRLAKRLRLKIPRDGFDKVRLECLRSYVQWVNGRTILNDL